MPLVVLENPLFSLETPFPSRARLEQKHPTLRAQRNATRESSVTLIWPMHFPILPDNDERTLVEFVQLLFHHLSAVHFLAQTDHHPCLDRKKRKRSGMRFYVKLCDLKCMTARLFLSYCKDHHHEESVFWLFHPVHAHLKAVSLLAESARIYPAKTDYELLSQDLSVIGGYSTKSEARLVMEGAGHALLGATVVERLPDEGGCNCCFFLEDLLRTKLPCPTILPSVGLFLLETALLQNH